MIKKSPRRILKLSGKKQKKDSRLKYSRKVEKNIKLLKKLLSKAKQEDSLFYGGSEFSVFRPVRKHVVRMMKKQFSKYYMYIGMQRNQTHQGFYPYLWGFYGKMSVIDPDLQVYSFRRMFRFWLALSLKNYRFCFISHQLAPYFRRSPFIFRYYMVFDYWIPGTVSNYKTLAKQKVRRRKSFLKRFPQVLVAFKLDAPKFYCVSKEAKKALMPMFSFFNTDIDISFFNYFFAFNLKILTSFKFCLFLINSLIRRALMVKKSRFIKKKINVSKKNKTK